MASKLLKSVVFILCILIMFTISCYADSSEGFWTYGYYNATIFFQNRLTNYQDELENAINSWTSDTYTRPLEERSFVANNVSSSYITNLDFSTDPDLEDNDAYGDIGLYDAFSQLSYACSCHKATAFSIRMNDHILTNAEGIYLYSSTRIQGYIAHELGHALGLDDHNIVSASTSIMRFGNNFSVFYLPQPFDVDNANTSWSIHVQ